MFPFTSLPNSRKEHQRHSPDCPFLKVKDPYQITVGEMIDLEHAALDYSIEQEADLLEGELQAIMAGMREELVRAATDAKAALKTSANM